TMIMWTPVCGPPPFRNRVIVTSLVPAAFGVTIRKEMVTGFPAVTGPAGLKSATWVTSTFWIVGVFGPPEEPQAASARAQATRERARSGLVTELPWGTGTSRAGEHSRRSRARSRRAVAAGSTAGRLL